MTTPGIIPGPLLPAGPEPIRRRYGLFTAASGPVDLPERGKGGGVRYVPVTCGVARTYGVNCASDSIGETEKIGDPENAQTEAGVFGVFSGLECGSVGFTAQEFEDKVRRRLTNGEQGSVEEAFWTGLDWEGNALDIAHLAESSDDVTVGDPLAIESVVSALEDHAYREEGYGHAAYIHAPVAVAAYAAEAGLVVQDGPLKVTPYGSVWVFGGGYPGTGASGAAPPTGGAYLHVTGQVQVWRSPDVFVFPPDQTMDREFNQRLLIAEREYAVGFDCLNGRALFNPLGGS